MRLTSLLKYFALGMLMLAAVILLEQFTNIDIWIENHFYDFETHQWAITPAEHEKLTYFFYKGMKCLVAAIGTLCVLLLLSSIKIKSLRPYITGALIVLLSTIIVPILAGQGKKITNVYCPNQTQIYEGNYPYVKIMQPYPASFQQIHTGRCFPAGHATGAFSLMSLFFFFKKRRNRILGLSLGIILGSISSGYQMLRGEHFLSHNLFTMIMSAMMILLINYAVKKIAEKIKPQN